MFHFGGSLGLLSGASVLMVLLFQVGGFLGLLLSASVLIVLLIYISGWRVPGSVVKSFCSDGFTDLYFRYPWVCCQELLF